jgi:hypothetical protein
MIILRAKMHLLTTVKDAVEARKTVACRKQEVANRGISAGRPALLRTQYFFYFVVIYLLEILIKLAN